jgi:hypothetical protein
MWIKEKQKISQKYLPILSQIYGVLPEWVGEPESREF